MLWFVVAVITFIALFVTVLIVYYSGLTLRLDYIGFNNFLTYFKVPLSICALNIPIVALLAANHRSEQTKEQIKISTSQNLFSNHYKHLEEFEKYYNSLACERVVKSTNVRKMHFVIFPNSRKGDYQIDLNILRSIEGRCNNIIKELNTFNKQKYFANQVVSNIERQVRLAENELLLKYNITSGAIFDYDGIKIILPSGDLKNYLDILKQRIVVINSIFQFDDSYVEFDSISKLTNLHLEQVPSINFGTQQTHTSLFSVI